jgi:Rrf2 family protein
MRLSRASRWALYGLSHLAGCPPGRPVPLAEIARRYGLPAKHLAKVFGTLVRAGILKSTRGIKGGFVLGRRADRISPLEIIEAVDGPLDDADCPLIDGACTAADVCPVLRVWRKALRRLIATLGKSTLASMRTGPRSALRPPRERAARRV